MNGYTTRNIFVEVPANRGDFPMILSLNGQAVPGKLVVLADNHPASSPTTQAFEIYYVGPTATFSQTNPTFQAMLQSFKFSG
jgi:hypothetical protein